MTNLPKAVLAAALIVGPAGMAITPAAAAKKEVVADTGPKLAVNEKVRAGQQAALVELSKIRALIAPAGNQVTAANKPAVLAAIQAAEPGIAAAEAAAQSNDELYVTQELRYRKESLATAAQYAGDQAGGDAAKQRLAPYLDRLLANPVTPTESVRTYALERGQIALEARQYAPALAAFQRAKAAGSTELMNDAYIVNTKILLGDYAGAATDSEPLIARYKAAGRKAPEPFYAVGIENAYRSKNLAAATGLEIQRLNEYPDPKNYHDALSRLLTRSTTPLDSRARLDVWRLMRATASLADQKERLLYADDALNAGSSREAQAVLEEFRGGRALTTFDPTYGKLLAQANTRVTAATSLTKIEADARASSEAQPALTAANFNYGAGNFAKAAELYKLARDRGAPDKDGLLISLGAAQAQAGDKPGAQASFQAVTASPRKEIAAYWLAWIARS